MLLIRCPYCEEERPELEFRNAGEAHVARSSHIADISDEDFEAFFFIRTNPKGITYERWRHVHGCARFFNAARETVSDKFLLTYKAGEPKPAFGVESPAAKPAAAKTASPKAKAVAPKAAASKPRSRKGEA